MTVTVSGVKGLNQTWVSKEHRHGIPFMGILGFKGLNMDVYAVSVRSSMDVFVDLKGLT